VGRRVGTGITLTFAKKHCMCYSIASLERKAERLARRYCNVLPPQWQTPQSGGEVPGELPLYYFVSGFAHPYLPVIRPDGMRMHSWGLIPHWAKDRNTALKIRKGTLNAVGETVFDKPSFRLSIRKKRCLLGVSGFFEWHGAGGKKFPYFIYREDREMFSLGCIYDSWADPESGEIIHSFGIITTPANPLLETIHNHKKRMPLIIAREQEALWTDPGMPVEELKAMIRPYNGNELRAHSVSRELNRVRENRNEPWAIEKASYAGIPDEMGSP